LEVSWLNRIDLNAMKWMYGILGILLAVSTAAAQSNPLVAKDSLAQNEWVEHQYERMTLEERIGQLFMVMASCEYLFKGKP
jgi:hypothetical protein